MTVDTWVFIALFLVGVGLNLIGYLTEESNFFFLGLFGILTSVFAMVIYNNFY